jgi:hypothetical protein
MKSKYYNLGQWRKAEPNAYNAAIKLKLLPKICQRFNWSHNYPKALNYSLKPLGLFYQNIKELKNNCDILKIEVVTNKKQLRYCIHIKECDFKGYRELICVNKLRVGVGLLSVYIKQPHQNKTFRDFGYYIQKFYLDVKLLDDKDIRKGCLDYFEKQSILYDKIIDYLLDDKFAHIKIK